MLKRSLPGHVITLVSTVFQVLAYVVFVHRVNPALPAEWRMDFTILVAVSTVLTVLLTVFRNMVVVSVLLLLKASIVLLVTVPLGDLPSVRILLFSSVLMESGTYLPLPFGLGVVGVLSVVCALRQDPAEAFRVPLPQPALLDRLVVLAVSLSLAALSVVLKRVAGRLSEEREIGVRLTSSVEKLTRANTEFLRYASVVEKESVASERNRITRDLHDIVGQSLTNIIMMMDAALHRAEAGTEEASRLYQWTRDQAQSCLEETRAALYELRSIPQEDVGSISSIKRLIDTYSGLTGVKVVVEWGNLPWELDEAIGHVVYRTIQESLSNSFRHGMATLVAIHFLVDQGMLNLMIRDNGTGGDVAKKGIGHAGMEERVRKLHGEIVFRREAPGYLVVARIPVPPQVEHEAS